MLKNAQKTLKYEDFIMQYVNNDKNFKFVYKNLTLDFYHKNNVCVLKLSDGITEEKIIKLIPPLFVNRIKINNIELYKLWDNLILIENINC